MGLLEFIIGLITGAIGLVIGLVTAVFGLVVSIVGVVGGLLVAGLVQLFILALPILILIWIF